MLAPWPSPLVLIAALVLVCGVAAIGAFVVVSLRKIETLQAGVRQRLDDLASRLRLIESRADRADEVAVTTGSARDRLSTSRPPAPPRGPGSAAPRPAAPEPSDAPAGPTLIAVPSLAAQAPQPDSQAEADLVQLHAEVWTLAAGGMPPAEISRQTGQPIGQVELIVGLYRHLHSSRGRIDHARSQ